MASPTLRGSDLRARLDAVSVRDAQRLSRRLDGVRRIKDPDRRSQAYAEVESAIDRGERAVQARRASVPPLDYPAELPVTARREDIARAITEHQVIVLAGATGSGKTTQLPKICLEAGRGVRGMIGHTQPRRIAARTVADRIAEEVGVELGGAIGYQVRFTDRVGPDTLVKVMTDGILLNEIQRDKMLLAYDTLILDEAHERSLNVDFILGFLRYLLPRRRDLKLIITSATIDPGRFAEAFDEAPVIEVSGRTYPVELRYRPLVDPDAPGREAREQDVAICDAVRELVAEGPGDILVFCSGEREIRDGTEAVERMRLRDTEVLPLYARLSTAEQHKVFAPHTGRRVVLSTNVAETSLTVPGIRYVVDTGLARVSRYSQRLKVQRLPIEPISQASADQRSGRCGRTSDGIAIRLYSEDDYDARPEFTDPEILRTNLASVILSMTALDLGDVADFPFIEAPDRRNVRDGVDLLLELGALEPNPPGSRAPLRLTGTGRRLAQLPLDPRLARMVLEADRVGVLREVLVIVAGMSVQDPRVRPLEHQQAADAKHVRFADPDSDFMAYLNLWRYLRERRRELSGSAYRRMIRDEYLHYLRIREWQDVHTQLRSVCKELGLSLGEPRDAVDAAAVAQALLAGLLSHVGLRDPESRTYDGARGASFAIFPGSALFKKQPQWVMAAELVETTRLWGRECARIDPAWVEKLAGHLVKRSYSEPHWERRRAAVVALEKVTLYGVPLVAGRRVTYGRIDPVASRELFIRHALVEGDWDTRHPFFTANRAMLEEVESLEERVRRRDIRVDDETLYEFYDARVGADVVSGRHFDTWWKATRREQPDLLDFEQSLLMRDDVGAEVGQDYPDEWRSGEVVLPLTYVFEPGATDDGVTVDVPLAQLNQVDAADFWWHVPGRREELVTALIKTLPKQWRRQFVPAPDHAGAVVGQLSGTGSIVVATAEALRRRTGVMVPVEAFELDAVPDHLRMTFRVVDGDREVARGKDLDALREQLRPRLRSALSKVAAQVEQTGLTSWSIGTLHRRVEHRRGAQVVHGFPALYDEGSTVGVRVFEDEAQQRHAMRQGTRGLLMLTVPSPVLAVVKRLDNRTKLTLTTSPYRDVLSLLEDCVAGAVDHLLAQHGGPAWDAAGFERLRAHVAGGLHAVTYADMSATVQALAPVPALRDRIGGLAAPHVAPVAADLRAQLSWLVHDGFVSQTGHEQLPHLPRYLKAVDRRLDRLPHDPRRDAQHMAVVQEVEDHWDEVHDRLPTHRRADADVRGVRWMIEELRVSLFAQDLGTSGPVSAKRIRNALTTL
ncbi:MAG: ATP-dependent RNA helicase HrpA [Actinomycetota bacterium]|nr:ATP-dependent RNA helicase HrpA [Actinomycetota bacterium]